VGGGQRALEALGLVVMNVGCQSLEVWDEVQGASLVLRLLYPSLAPEQPEPFGAFQLSVAVNAPIEGQSLPLVVISHGTGGTPFTHRDLAAHLARAGFVVALLQHPGNHRGDDSLSGTVANLQNRPRHVRLAIDAALAHERIGGRIAQHGVAVIGHSMGGYTALAVAGGQPSAMGREALDGGAGPVQVEHDARVNALVLLAPATPWFMAEGALIGVKVPVLMWTAGKDTHTDPFHARIVQFGLRPPARLEHQVVPNGGHFAFLSAYPPELKNPAVPPSQDPEGFDRAAFLPVLFADIVRFLRQPG
jgi:predicted dienelactone hydrolase